MINRSTGASMVFFLAILLLALVAGAYCVGPTKSQRNLVVTYHDGQPRICWEVATTVETKPSHITWNEGEGTVVVAAPYSVTAVNGGPDRWVHAYNRLGLRGRFECPTTVFTRIEKPNRDRFNSLMGSTEDSDTQ